MASFNNTQTKLIRTTNRYSSVPSTRLTPIPLPGESFYFNQDYVKTKISCIRVPINNQVFKRTSVHITDKRIIFLAQPLTDTDDDSDDHQDNHALWTFQLDLPFILSLKTTNLKKHKLVLDISVRNQWESIQIHLSFNNQKKKKDHARRDSFKEYINLVMAGYASNRASSTMRSSLSSPSIPTTTPLMRHSSNASSTFNHYYYTPSVRSSDHLPTYLQALTDAPLIPSSFNSLFTSHQREELPPAYS
ncbi:unnamed protein product [Cunninghamella blakesleeana]